MNEYSLSFFNIITCKYSCRKHLDLILQGNSFMRKSSKKYMLALRLCCAVVITALLACLCGCAGKADSLLKLNVGAPVAYPEATDLSAHYFNPDNLTEISTSGLITLLFDENSSSVGIRVNGNSNSSKLWSALPEYSEGETLSDEAEIVSLEIVHNSSRYILNSQDCCVSNGTVFRANTKDGFTVVYYITDMPALIKDIDAAASDEAYSEAAGDNILFKVSVCYTLKDGCLYASLDWVNLGNKDDVLVKIGFLEHFGATVDAQEGDFLLVPDGSGALIDTFSEEALEPVSVAVYGNDIGGASALEAIAPAFGLKSGSDAFAAIIENGDAVAQINAAKAHNSSAFNRVGACFVITPSQIDGDDEIFSECVYSDTIEICYRFLSGADATYSGLAAACREQFIRNYTLSSSGLLSAEAMPIVINVIGQAKKDGIFGFNKKLTSYSQAQDILNRIKSKGIDNVYLRYSGALSGGLDAENIRSAKLLSSLGGEKDFSALNDYAAGLNFNVFVDISLLSGSNAGNSAVGNLTEPKTTFDRETIFNKTGFASETSKTYYTELSGLERTVLSALEKFTDFDSTGFCVTDAGERLYTDFTGGINRQTAASIINDEISPLATQNIVMVQKGNFYSLKNADIVCDIPMSCKHIKSEGYISIPFVQLILHGIVEFSGAPVNISNNSKQEFLRCIEYGAIPSFVLTNNSLDKSEEYSKIFSTDNWLASIYNCYNQSSEVFADLRDSRITDHFKVAEGVYCTEFESTTKVYVNYTNEPFTVGGITVEPLNFFRVN